MSSLKRADISGEGTYSSQEPKSTAHVLNGKVDSHLENGAKNRSNDQSFVARATCRDLSEMCEGILPECRHTRQGV